MPGEFVNAHLTVDVRHGGISVPLSAIEQRQDGAVVFVVLPDGSVRERPVVLAETLDRRALVERGAAGRRGGGDGRAIPPASRSASRGLIHHGHGH
jgi:multidrug efflux pump subunit AcrA (membrane-fusion protein)